MGKKLIVAEKPSVGKDIAYALGVRSSGSGYIENSDYIVTWGFGHIVGLAEPDAQNPEWKGRWRLSMLPMIPNNMKRVVLKGKGEQFETIKSLMNSNRVDEIVEATDAEREGELIFRYIYALAGCKKPFKRIWISDFNPGPVRQAFQNMRPGSEFDGLAYAGKARDEADWLFGFNLTRLFSAKTGDSLPAGRVMCPTLKILVDRRMEIENFKPQDYWTVTGTFSGDENDPFQATCYLAPEYKDNKFWAENEAGEVVKACSGQQGKVTSAEKKKGRSSPPLLFSQSALQKEMSSRHSMTAEQTLSVAQSLYERHKLITYPRTGSQFITNEVYRQSRKNIEAAGKNFPDLADRALSRIDKKPRVVDDSKCEAHYAIIPTGRTADLSKLSSDEKRVYEAVARRFLAAFMEPSEHMTSTIWVDVNGHKFKATGKIFIKRGWLEAEPWRSAKDNPLPDVTEGVPVTTEDIAKNKHQTKPPAHFNDGTLVDQMLKCGKDIDDEEMAALMKEVEGLGTEATRDATIKKIIDYGYAKRQKKAIVATDKGVQFVSTFEGLAPGLFSPETTASWETRMKSIERGQDSYHEFIQGIQEFVQNCISTVKEEKLEDYQNQDNTKVGQCPLCGGDVIERKKGFSCMNWHEDNGSCRFTIWKSAFGGRIREKVAKELLENGVTSKKLKLKSKQGKQYEAKLQLQSDGRVAPLFEDSPGSGGSASDSGAGSQDEEPLGDCPVCPGGKIVERSKGFGCNRYSEGCKFIVWKNQFGGKITAKTVKELLQKGITSKKLKLKSKAGKQYEAALKLEDGRVMPDFGD